MLNQNTAYVMPQGGVRVAVAGEEALQVSVEGALSPLGVWVESYFEPEALLDCLMLQKPPELVVLAAELPGWKGVEVIEFFRQVDVRTPVYLVIEERTLELELEADLLDAQTLVLSEGLEGLKGVFLQALPCRF